MSENAKSNEVYWVEPKLRGIIPLDGFHVSRSLKKIIDKGDYTVTYDTRLVMRTVLKLCKMEY